MRIESALNSSREGLTSHSNAITAVSDNISNANTTGYKAARVEFSDLFSEGYGIKDGGPLSTGNGSQTVAVRPIQTAGDTEFTGRALDAAVQGDGYFIVGTEADPLYTRAGNFQLNADGYLVTTDGQFVLGSTGTSATGGTTLSKINLAQLSSSAKPTSLVTLGANLSSGSEIRTAPGTAPDTFTALGQAASTVQSGIEVYDSQGARHEVFLALFKTDVNTWTAQAYMDGKDLSGGTEGKPVLLGSLAGLKFQPDGTLADADKAGAVITATGAAYANGASAPSFTINMSGYTQTANPSELRSKSQDGISTGSIKSYQIEKDGKIIATLSNGSFADIANLQIAKFTNMDGLVRQGNSYYKEGGTAGKRTLGTPGSSGLGEIQGGALERSTTDLAKEFVDLVIYQRGYQANSQVFSSASQVIRDTIGMIR